VPCRALRSAHGAGSARTTPAGALAREWAMPPRGTWAVSTSVSSWRSVPRHAATRSCHAGRHRCARGGGVRPPQGCDRATDFNGQPRDLALKDPRERSWSSRHRRGRGRRTFVPPSNGLTRHLFRLDGLAPPPRSDESPRPCAVCFSRATDRNGGRHVRMRAAPPSLFGLTFRRARARVAAMR